MHKNLKRTSESVLIGIFHIKKNKVKFMELDKFIIYRDKISRRLINYKKYVYWILNGSASTTPVFIMGCGRSGTQMMLNVLERDERIQVLRENDPKIARNYMLVKEFIKPAIENCRAPVLIMKPILNSFEVSNLLTEFDQSKVIWIVRSYKDMAASSVNKFGSRVSEYIKHVVESGIGDNWISSGIPSDTLQKLRCINTKGFNNYDWMCLIWWSVNLTVLKDKLYKNRRFILLNYDKMVYEPDLYFLKIYNFIGLSKRIKNANYIHSKSVGKGSKIKLHPIVNKMCFDLTNSLISLSSEII